MLRFYLACPIRSAKIRYAKTPVPAQITKNTNNALKITGSRLKYSPRPPHTPANFLSVADFVNFLLVNAIRLKNETGILDFTSMEALNEIGLFRNSELAIFESDNYATDIMYNIIFNSLFKKYYTSGFDCEFKDFLFVKPLLDINLKKMHRENNNLVSVSELLKEKGASVIRTYYAMIGCSDDVLYNEESILEAMELIEKTEDQGQ